MDFRPCMVETSHEFIRGSRLLWENGLGFPSMVNAAIGLEILFKSFNAEDDGPGGDGEQFSRSKIRSHNLLKLFDSIPKEIRETLGFQTYRDYFDGSTYFGGGAEDLFVQARYPYEKHGASGGAEAFIEIAEEMLHRVVQEYKIRGCSDLRL